MVALSAMLLAAAVAVPAPAQRALDEALALPGARVVVSAWDPSSACAPVRAEVSAAIRGSGRVAVRLFGAGCDGWAWAQVRVFAPALVAEAAIPAGAPVAGKVRRDEREVRAGHDPIAALPAGAVAARTLPAGSVLEARHVRAPASIPGARVRVVLHSGALALETTGRVVPCPGPGTCAELPHGARVQGQVEGDRLVVEVP